MDYWGGGFSMRHAAYLLLGAAISTAASAADLPMEPTPAELPVVSQPFSWTGFYAGLNAGGGWNNTDAKVKLTDPGGAFFGPCLAAGTCPTGTLSYDVDGFVAGGQVGGDWQTGMFVFGIVGDLDFSDMSGKRSESDAAGTFVASGKSDYDWFGTVRARIGAAFDRVLVYGTGGAAFASVKDTGLWGFVPNTYSASHSDTLVGWTAGGGVEFAVTDHIAVGGEALYFDLGDNSFNMTPAPGFTPPVGTNVKAQFDHSGVLARGKVSFRW
jgi:outer membrane immunogenic protein